MHDTARGTIEGRRVLVVDDSSVIRAIVSKALREAAFEVQEAADGTAGLERLSDGDYDVLVTDLQMPLHDGFELLEHVKNRGLCTEVVILTGEHAEDMSSALRALRLGAHDYLRKPAAPEEIVLAVERAAEKKRLREANVRLMRELEALSRTDPLTGVGNRRAFDDALANEKVRAARYDLTLSLVMFDVDHFKNVNDTYGHPTGDAVLKFFARTALEVLRTVDSFYRYGGEEFAALLPHTPLQGALRAGARVVEALARTPFLHRGAKLSITVSAGVASARGRESDYDLLVSHADAALYQAKQTGRNRAVAAIQREEP